MRNCYQGGCVYYAITIKMIDAKEIVDIQLIT